MGGRKGEGWKTRNRETDTQRETKTYRQRQTDTGVNERPECFLGLRPVSPGGYGEGLPGAETCDLADMVRGGLSYPGQGLHEAIP